jgi:hypothetical protein
MTQQVKTDFKDAVDISVTEPTADAAAQNIVKEKIRKGQIAILRK